MDLTQLGTFPSFMFQNPAMGPMPFGQGMLPTQPTLSAPMNPITSMIGPQTSMAYAPGTGGQLPPEMQHQMFMMQMQQKMGQQNQQQPQTQSVTIT